MNNHLKPLSLALLLATSLTARAQLTIPGADGSDGIFAPTVSTNIDLALAATGVWSNAPAVAGQGVYDPEKWAVVFKFSSVNIPSGVTVSFRNHPSRAPVVWLVDGDANIAGVLNLNGRAIPESGWWEPGPGGFRSGYRDVRIGFSYSGGGGFGLGGANPDGSFAGYGSPGANYPGYPIFTGPGPGGTYGNARILPLIGGSGASSHSWNGGQPTSPGGGAILIAARSTLSVNGGIEANDAEGYFGGVGGSGGAIRLIAHTLTGNGRLVARNTRWQFEGLGRIRTEAVNYTGALLMHPQTAVVTPDAPLLIWPPGDAPTVQIVSVGGVPVSSDPRSNLEAPGADVNFQSTDTIDIMIEARNLSTNATVGVRVTPKLGSAATGLTATLVSGDNSFSVWRARAAFSQGYAALQVRAISP